jgi:hypothetical protein
MPNWGCKFFRQKTPTPNPHNEARKGRNVESALRAQLDPKHHLDWSEVSKPLQTFMSGALILSLLSKQQAHDDIYNGEGLPEDVHVGEAGDGMQVGDEDGGWD